MSNLEIETETETGISLKIETETEIFSRFLYTFYTMVPPLRVNMGHGIG